MHGRLVAGGVDGGGFDGGGVGLVVVVVGAGVD